MNAVGKIYELSQSTGIELSFTDEQDGFGFSCTCNYGTYSAKGEISGTKKAAKLSAATKMLEMLRGKSSRAATIASPQPVKAVNTPILYQPDVQLPPPGIKFYPSIKKGSEDITLFNSFCFIAADVAQNWPRKYEIGVLYVFVGASTDIRNYILKAFTPPIDQNHMYPNIRQHVVPDILAATKLIYMNAGALLSMGKQCVVFD
jgi:hypothetical protein